MCDTFVALKNATVDGSVILGKNSDREPNEAHEIRVFPACDYPEGSQVQCTYISIPQAAHTFSVLLAKPFWIWGAEMGVNEHGVAIGNEAIFTRVPHEPQPGLIGMDLLRLALERAESAWKALYVITDLLEKYGQGGSCGFTHPFHYHNSFLIADQDEAWVLETAGRQWVAEKVTSVRAISNAATIGSTWDLASDDVVKYAVDRGWCRGRADFHFARCYSDIPYTTLSDARARRKCATHLLEYCHPKASLSDAMRILRAHSHSRQETNRLRVDHSFLRATVCMHAGAGPVRGSQSVGSLVAHLNGMPTAWVTGTSAPCTGIFKPVWLDAGFPLNEPQLSGTFDPECLWWRHERLHRAVLRSPSTHLPLFSGDRDLLEEEFVQRTAACEDSAAARRALSEECFEAAGQAEERWLERVFRLPQVRGSSRFYYENAWKRWSRQAGMELETVQN